MQTGAVPIIRRDPIVDAVINKFMSRSQVGILKYGTTLHENNTDDFLEHLQQELMDAILYIEKLKTNDNKTRSISVPDSST